LEDDLNYMRPRDGDAVRTVALVHLDDPKRSREDAELVGRDGASAHEGKAGCIAGQIDP
jgi:hypothetical protein